MPPIAIHRSPSRPEARPMPQRLKGVKWAIKKDLHNDKRVPGKSWLRDSGGYILGHVKKSRLEMVWYINQLISQHACIAECGWHAGTFARPFFSEAARVQWATSFGLYCHVPSMITSYNKKQKPMKSKQNTDGTPRAHTSLLRNVHPLERFFPRHGSERRVPVTNCLATEPATCPKSLLVALVHNLLLLMPSVCMLNIVA